MKEKLYYRICKGLKDYGKYYPVEKSVHDVIDDYDTDWYKSVYFYTEKQVQEADEDIEVINKKSGDKYFRKRGIAKLSGADGTFYDTVPGITNKLVFDFDDAEKPENALKELKELVGKLEHFNVNIDDCEIIFSANKGYHLIVNTDKYFNSSEMRSICMSLTENMVTRDTTVYNDARIIRIPHTKHQKSGRYCTPLFMEDLTGNFEDHCKLSEGKFLPEIGTRIVSLPEEILEMKNNIIKVEKAVVESIGSSFEEMKEAIQNMNFLDKWKNMPAQKWVLHQGYIPRGFGQEARMILASTYKAMQFCETDAYRMLKSVSERRVEITGDPNSAFDTDEVWTNVIQTVFSDVWQGGCYGINHVLLKSIDSLIPINHRYERIGGSLVMDKREGFSRFVEYAKNIDKNTIKFGIKGLDDNLRIMTSNVYGFLASPGVGKTSISLQIMEYTSRTSNKVMYFSFDMSMPDTYAKILTRHTSEDEEVILKKLKDGTEEEKEKYFKLIEKYYSNVDFVFKPGLTIEDMENCLLQREDETGIKTKLIVVDYLSLIKTPGADGNQKNIEAIQGLRYLAHNLNLAVFVLLQPNKINSTPDEPIKSYNAIKGSSEIPEACTAVLTGYRPGFDPLSYGNDHYFTFICVKNRKGRLFSADFNWRGKEGLIRELEGPERDQLKMFREMKKELKEEERKNSGIRGSGTQYF